MRIVELEFRNFRGLRHFHAKFGPGLIGLVGPNGSGKSSVGMGLLWLLTGYLAATKEDTIYDGKRGCEGAWGRVIVSHGSRVFCVIRRLDSSPNAEITFLDGSSNRTIEGDKKVTQQITDILGVSTTVIADVVLLGQKKLVTLFDEIPSKRLDRLQKLFDMDRFDAIYDGLHRRVLTLRAATSEKRKAGLASLAQWLKDKNDAEAVLQNLATEESLVERGQRIVAAQNQAMRIEAAMSARDRLDAVRARASQYAQHLSTLAAQQEKAKDDIGKATEALIAAGSEADRAETNRLRAARIEELRSRHAEATTRLQAWLGVEEPPVSFEETKRAVVELAAAIRLDEDVALLATAKECHVCHTPVEAIRVNPQEAMARLPAERTQHRLAKNREQQWDVFKKKESTVAELQTFLRGIESELAAAVPPGPPADPTLQPRLQRELAGLKNGLAQIDNSILSAERSLAAAQAEIAGLEATIRDVAGPDMQIPAPADPGWIQNENREIQQARSQRRVAEDIIKRAAPQIEAAQKVCTDTDKAWAWLLRMEAAEMNFHRTGIPGRLLLEKLRELEGVMNSFLSGFSAFGAAFDDNAEFSAVFPDGRQRHQSLLSGGQEIMMAIAFVLAQNTVVAQGLGSLFLDEPTVWLDAERVRSFENVIGGLRHYVQSRGLQCFIVTHAKELGPLFDEVVSLA